MRRARRLSARGLTLFEVTISIALIGMLLAALMTFFWQSGEIRSQASKNAARARIVRLVLSRIAGELQNAVALERTGFESGQQFVGDRRKITFLTTPLPQPESYAFFRESERGPAPRHDLIEVTYELWIDPDEKTESGDPLVGGILRTERRVMNPSIPEDQVVDEQLAAQQAEAGQGSLYLRHDLWSYELGYLEFRYFDGVEWSTTWQVSQGNALPHLVQVTIGFDSLTREELEDQDLREYPIDQYPLGPDVANINRFSRMVRVPAADPMFSARMHRLGDEVEEVYEFNQPGTEGDGEKQPAQGGQK